MARRERNRVVVAVVAVLILGLAVYGPMALLAPLPPTPGTPSAAADSAPAAAQTDGSGGPVLATAGESAVTLAVDAAPITAGSAEPVPMAATAKLVTALVVLEQHPLAEGAAGPAIRVTAEDFAAYTGYTAEGTKAVRVVPGDSWSQRETLQATLIASSNNHAEMLANWAFGSPEEYLRAAAAWVTEHGLDSTTVTDPTGLSPESVSTAADLAKLAALAMAEPVIAAIVAAPNATTLRGLDFENTISYRAADGVLGMSRSYTDEAGVCLLIAYPVEVVGSTVTVYAAFAGEPSYDSLDADVSALLDSLPDALSEQKLVVTGGTYGTYSTPWGTRIDAVAEADVVGIGWAGAAAAGANASAELDPVGSARKGATVGRVTVQSLTGPQSSALVLAQTLGDPGPVWRLLHPGVVVPAFVESLGD